MYEERQNKASTSRQIQMGRMQTVRFNGNRQTLQMNPDTAKEFYETAKSHHDKINRQINDNKENILKRNPKAEEYIDNPFTVAVSEGHWASSGGASLFVNPDLSGKERIWGKGQHAEVKIISQQDIKNLGVSNKICNDCHQALKRHNSLEHYAEPPSPGIVYNGKAASPPSEQQPFSYLSDSDISSDTERLLEMISNEYS